MWRVAALEEVNRQLLEIRDLARKQLQASEGALRAKEREHGECMRAKEKELAECKSTQRDLEDNVRFRPAFGIRSKLKHRLTLV